MGKISNLKQTPRLGEGFARGFISRIWGYSFYSSNERMAKLESSFGLASTSPNDSFTPVREIHRSVPQQEVETEDWLQEID